MISNNAVLSHKRFHTFEGKIHFINPTKSFLPRLAGERSKNVQVLWLYILVVAENTEDAVHL